MSANNKMDINLKTSLNHNSKFVFWRLLNVSVSGILLAVVIFGMYFIYDNTNTALTNATTALDIKSKITFDALNIDKYEVGKKYIINKDHPPTLPNKIRNIFNYELTTTTSTRTTSST